VGHFAPRWAVGEAHGLAQPHWRTGPKRRTIQCSRLVSACSEHVKGARPQVARPHVSSSSSQWLCPVTPSWATAGTPTQFSRPYPSDWPESKSPTPIYLSPPHTNPSSSPHFGGNLVILWKLCGVLTASSWLGPILRQVRARMVSGSGVFLSSHSLYTPIMLH
jgi:hypothetical protein